MNNMNTMEEFVAKTRVVCPQCNNIDEFEGLVFLSETSTDNTFNSDLNGKYKNIGKHFCSACQHEFEYPIFFGYYSKRYDATIIPLFYDYDYPDLRERIKTIFGLFGEFIHKDLHKLILNKPYVFVNGWNGLRNFFEIINSSDQQPNFPEQEREDFSIWPMRGFAYGKIFFYYPSQLQTHHIIQALLDLSRCSQQASQHEYAYQILKECSSFLKNNSIEIFTELAVLAYQLDKKQEAQDFINLAHKQQHKWLSGTIDFIDPTPRKRADGITQESESPNTSIDSRKRLVDVPHTVTMLYPAIQDINIFAFPNLEYSCAQYYEPSPEEYAHLYAILLGEIMYFTENFTLYNYKLEHRFYELSLSLTQKLQPVSSAVFEKFWIRFAARYLKLPENLLSESMNDVKSLEEMAQKYGKAMGKLRKSYNQEKTSEETYMSFLFKHLEEAISKEWNRFSQLPSNKNYKSSLDSFMQKAFYDETGLKIEMH